MQVVAVFFIGVGAEADRKTPAARIVQRVRYAVDIFGKITNTWASGRSGRASQVQDDNHSPSAGPVEASAEIDRQEEPPTMDVSPPQHPVHNWRDVLVHLGIVTAGLFIALMLEGVVQWVHHKSLVREARQNIGIEIRSNRNIVRRDLAFVAASLKGVESNIAILSRLRQGQDFHGTLANRMDFAGLDVAAWRTARDTGALGYMPYDEVQNYSGLYTTIDYLNGRALAVEDTEFKAFAPAEMGYEFKDIPPEERTAMLRGIADSKIGLITLQQLLEQVDQALAEAEHPRG